MSNAEELSTEKICIRPRVLLTKEALDGIRQMMKTEVRKTEGDMISIILNKMFAGTR